MTEKQDATSLANVGLQVADEGLVARLMQTAVNGLKGQVPSGAKIAVAAQILGIATARTAAVALHGPGDRAFSEAITSLCEGIAITAAQCRAYIEKAGL
jgi:hypothetical protein